MFYPKTTKKITVKKLDKAIIAERILAHDGLSKCEVVGLALQGSDDIETFEEVWKELEAESRAMESVDKELKDIEYKAELEKVQKYLDVDRFVNVKPIIEV